MRLYREICVGSGTADPVLDVVACDVLQVTPNSDASKRVGWSTLCISCGVVCVLTQSAAFTLPAASSTFAPRTVVPIVIGLRVQYMISGTDAAYGDTRRLQSTGLSRNPRNWKTWTRGARAGEDPWLPMPPISYLSMPWISYLPMPRISYLPIEPMCDARC
eukprot:2663088-Rhodomonas_salina.8